MRNDVCVTGRAVGIRARPCYIIPISLLLSPSPLSHSSALIISLFSLSLSLSLSLACISNRSSLFHTLSLSLSLSHNLPPKPISFSLFFMTYSWERSLSLIILSSNHSAEMRWTREWQLREGVLRCRCERPSLPLVLNASHPNGIDILLRPAHHRRK